MQSSVSHRAEDNQEMEKGPLGRGGEGERKERGGRGGGGSGVSRHKPVRDRDAGIRERRTEPIGSPRGHTHSGVYCGFIPAEFA